MSSVGDSPWVCPSCGNFLGGYKGNSKGSVVTDRGVLRIPKGRGWMDVRVDIVHCQDCGVLFAVDEKTVPEEG
jgi:hypothetical protein